VKTVLSGTMATFCPACEEVAGDGTDGICLTCGEELVAPPSTGGSGNNRNGRRRDDAIQASDGDAAATNAMALMLATSTEGAAAVDPSALLLTLLDRPRGYPTEAAMGSGGVDDLAGVLPAEALDPQAAPAGIRPASRAALDGLRRAVLTPQSAELFDAHLSVYGPRRVDDPSPLCAPGSDGCLTLNAVPGEFGWGELDHIASTN